MSQATRFLALAAGLITMAACSDTPTAPDVTAPVKAPRSFAVTAAAYSGNPTCADLGYHGELKLDPPADGSYSNSMLYSDPLQPLHGTPSGQADGYLSVTVTGIPGMTNINWSSNHAVDLVLVKYANGGIGYSYDPAATSGTVSTGVNSNNQFQAVSHIDFCYEIELDVAKTANTTFTRTWSWDIAKTATGGPFIFSGGQPDGGVVSYAVTVTRNAAVDSNWGVNGTITVKNPTILPITVASVGDALVSDNVTCPGGLPANLGANASLVCTYSGSLSSGTNTTNVATASSSTALIGDGSASAAVTFGDPTTKVDECAAVGDDKKGSLAASLCGSQTFNYTIDIASAVSSSCVDGTYTNTATVDPATSHSTETSSASVTYTMNCGNEQQCDPAIDPTCNPNGDPGCTLTQGYWKTHSIFGPAAKPDATWSAVGGPTASWFGTSYTWLQMFNTAVKGNAYWDLAHQYGAALLNVANGADATAVASAMSYAATFFATKNPATKLSATDKAAATAAAAALGAFNEGVAAGGPPHCSQ